MHTHLPRDVAEHHMTIFQLDLEGRIGEVFENLTLHFDVIFLRHKLTSARPENP